MGKIRFAHVYTDGAGECVMFRDIPSTEFRSNRDGVPNQDCEGLGPLPAAKDLSESSVSTSAEACESLEQHAELGNMLAVGYVNVEHGCTVDADGALSQFCRELSRQAQQKESGCLLDGHPLIGISASEPPDYMPKLDTRSWNTQMAAMARMATTTARAMTDFVRRARSWEAKMERRPFGISRYWP